MLSRFGPFEIWAYDLVRGARLDGSWTSVMDKSQGPRTVALVVLFFLFFFFWVEPKGPLFKAVVDIEDEEKHINPLINMLVLCFVDARMPMKFLVCMEEDVI